MKTEQSGKDLLVSQFDCFNDALTLDCGQAFRWKQDEDGFWCGVAHGRYLKLKTEGDTAVFCNTSEDDFRSVWYEYFDFGTDYAKILSEYNDESLKKACSQYYGIRILKQDEWETVCSFIISANNNIPRIKGIIDRLCENFGEEILPGIYSFPTAERLASLEAEDLAVIRSGFRAKYIIDAARKISSGEVDIEKVKKLPFNEAKDELLKIKGVGEKVAQCALLYGFGRHEAFPVDVWVKRIVAELYPDGLPGCISGTQGIAQQYLFHWRRNLTEHDT